jgi:hypothetical protein
MDVDLISWRIDTRLLSPTAQAGDNDTLVLKIAFPYADDGTPTESPATHSHAGANGQGSNWDSTSDSRHTSTLSLGADGQSAYIGRQLDHDAYEVVCRWSDSRYSVVADGPHGFILQTPSQQNAVASAPQRLEMSCLLAPPSARYPVGAAGRWLANKTQQTLPLLRSRGASLPLYAAVAANAAQGWEQFWQSGAAIDLAGNLDPAMAPEKHARALEFERRVVLSQYLTRSQSAGSLPPQETGYTMNSWMGRFQ